MSRPGWMGIISHFTGPVALLAEALQHRLPCSPWLCKPEGQGTVAFGSVPNCERQKEEGFSFPFPLPSFRTPQLCKSAPEHSPLLCTAIPSPMAGGQSGRSYNSTEGALTGTIIPVGWWPCFKFDSLEVTHHPHSYRGEPWQQGWTGWSLRSLPNQTTLWF